MDRTAVELQHLAAAHLWGHFTHLVPDDGAEIEIIERGEGCYVWDQHGQALPRRPRGPVHRAGRPRPRRAGRGRRQAGRRARPTSRSGPTPTRPPSSWPPSSPSWRRATSTGCSSPPADPRPSSPRGSWPASTSRPSASPAATRSSAATSPTTAPRWGPWPSPASRRLRAPFEPLVPGAFHVANTNRYRCDLCAHAPACTLSCADDIERTILAGGPRVGGRGVPRAGAERRRLLHPARGLLRPGPRDLRPLRRAAHLATRSSAPSAGSARGSAASASATSPTWSPWPRASPRATPPSAACMVSDKVAEPFLDPENTFMHGITFAGHPVSCAVALANLEVFERDGILEQRAGQRGRPSAPPSPPSRTCRGSARSAAWATSTRSSW